MNDAMRRMIFGLSLLCLVLTLGACGAKQSAEKAAATEQDHLWKSQQEALKKAEAMEDEVLKAAEKQRKEIDRQAH